MTYDQLFLLSDQQLIERYFLCDRIIAHVATTEDSRAWFQGERMNIANLLSARGFYIELEEAVCPVLVMEMHPPF